MKNLFNSLFLFLAFVTTAFSQIPAGNTGLYFDGVDDIATTTAINIGGNTFTFEAWVKPHTLGKSAFLFWTMTGCSSSQIGFGIEMDTDGQFVFSKGCDGNRSISRFASGTANKLEVNKWSHIAVVVTGTQVQLFKDGVLIASRASNTASFSSLPLYIADWSGVPFNGEIDEVKIFKTARLDKEIVLDMKSVAADGALAYFDFNDDLSAGNQLYFLNKGSLGTEVNGSLPDSPRTPLWAYRVTNTTDIVKNQGSLRWAINETELDTDKDYIDFSIQQIDLTVKGISTIQQTTDFPIIKQAIIIDGYSAYGSSVNTNIFSKGTNANLRTELIGYNPSTIFNVSSSGSLIKGLAFGAGDVAINLDGTNNQVSGNFFGLRADGSPFTASFGNSAINLLGVNNVIGSLPAATNFADLNVITQAKIKGVSITSNNSSVRNNYIGTDATGLKELNTANAIWLQNTSTGVIIEGNCIISNNAINFQTIGTGPWVSSSISIMNNLMGVFVDGSTYSGMDRGVYVLNASTSSLIKGNTIANAGTAAIDISNLASGHQLTSNKIYCSVGSAILLNTSGNNSKEMPLITLASPTLISGNTKGASDSVEIFRDNLPVCGTPNQGRFFLGKVLAKGGFWSFTPQTSLALGERITATASDLTSGTSPFSESKLVAVVCNPLVVTSIADDGVCGTLRSAIEFANSNAGRDTILFNIAGQIPHTINLSSPLPPLRDVRNITEGTFIDGFSQPGSKPNTVHPLDATIKSPMNAVHGIVVNGIVPATGSGFLLSGDNNSISGLILYDFSDGKTANGTAISISGKGNQVLGCLIGLDESGTRPSSKTIRGVLISGIGNNVGNGTPSGANVISGLANTGQGIGIAANLNSVKGNMIGLQKDGSSLVVGAGQNTGVYLGTQGATNSIGGASIGDGNVISGNNSIGISFDNTILNKGNVISGNIIGTQADGLSLVAGNKQQVGVDLNNARNVTVGGKTAAERNIISGNQSIGVNIIGANSLSNSIIGNYIGLDKTGTSIIVGSTQAQGVSIGAGVSSNTIGGELAGEGNVISGNTQNGIQIGGTYTEVKGNIIGLQKDGLSFLASNSQQDGVYISNSLNIIGGNTAAARNILSGNTNSGVLLSGTSALIDTIKGNYIGTNSLGQAITGSNQVYGVLINNGASNNVVGVASTGQGNLIAYNGTGIYSIGPTSIGNAFSANSIHSNTLKGININYGTAQANNGKILPVVSSINGNVILGTCEAGNVVEVYDDSPQFGTTDQGRTYLGLANVTGTTWTFTSKTATARVTALARDTKYGSSEFSLSKVSTVFRPFVTTWETTFANETITIPTTGTGYNYNVSWGDGTSSTATGNATHTYTKPGIYQVAISGAFTRIYFNGTGDATKIKSIDQWGDIAWTSMDYAFSGCSNLTYTAKDTPILTGVTSISFMFSRATSFNGDINNWDVSNITSMSGVFQRASKFNQPLDKWDVSKVASMNLMFNQCSVFNQSLNTWDVSNVSTMSGMFNECLEFNQPLDKWDVSSVENMSSMFSYSYKFNQDLSTWKIDNVINMSFMFSNAYSFDQDLSSWFVGKVTNMSQMFNQARLFDQDLSKWDVSKVANMSSMFSGAQVFNQSLKNWNIAAVTTMANMLDGTKLSLANYDATLIAWSAQAVKSGVALGASGLQYCVAVSERTSLVSKNSWVITDAGLNCPLVLAVSSTDISQTGFTATWTNMGVNTTYELEIAIDVAFVSKLTGYPKTSIKDTFLLVTGLNPGTTYYYRVRKTGDLVFSAFKTINTLSLPAPTTVCANKVGQTVELSWAQVVGATAYTISYGADSTSSTLNVVSVLGNTSSIVINSNLSLTNTNYFSVAAINGKASFFKPALPGVEAGLTQRVCSGTQVKLTANSSTGSIISWNQNVKDGVAFTPVVGSVLYKVNASLKGCISTDTVRVIVDGIPTLSVVSQSSVCSPSTVDLSGSSLATSGTLSYWQDAKTLLSLVNFKAVGTGKYYIKATNLNNPLCFVIDSVNVIVNQTPLLNVLNTNPINCQDKNGSIRVKGLVSGVKYAWSYKNTLSELISDSSVANLLGIILISDTLKSGTYKDVSVSVKGCTSELKSVIITDPNAPNIDAGLAQNVCSGTSIKLSVKNLSNALITWGGGIKDGEMFVPKIGNVLYTVTATLLGCTSSDTVRVIVDSVPVLSLQESLQVCSSSTVDLTSSVATTSGIISYWKDKITQIPMINFTVAGTGKYYVKAINSDNPLCFVVDSIDVTEIENSDKKLNVSINNGTSLINSENINLLNFSELSETKVRNNTSLGEAQFVYENDSLKIDYLPKSNQFGKDTLTVSVEDICNTIVSDTFIITIKKSDPVVVELTMVKTIEVISLSTLSADLTNNLNEIRIIDDASYANFLSFETLSYIEDGLKIDTALKVKVIKANLPERFKKEGGDVVNVFYHVCDVNGTNCGETLSLALRIDLEVFANVSIVDGKPDFSGFKNKKVKDLLEIEVINNALSRNRGLKFDYKWDGKPIPSDSLAFDISIYSRWGDLVYHEIGEGKNVNWKGEYQSDGVTVFETVEDGNYFWILSVKYKIGEDNFKYGFKTGYLYYVDLDFKQ